MDVGDENTVTHYSGCALVAVGECLNVAEQNKRKKSFLEDIALAINESHSIFKCLSDLGFIVKGSVVCSGYTDTAMSYVSFNA